MRKHLLAIAVLLGIATLVQAQPCRPNTSSLSVNGTNGYAELTSEANCNPSNAITVEAWIRPAAFATTKDNGSIVCNHGWSAGGQQGFVLRCGGNGILSFNIAGTTTGATTGNWREVLTGTNVLSLGVWQHVAATFNGDSLKLYLNGVQVAASAFAGTIANSPNAYPMSIGRLADPSQSARRYFNGLIDEVRIWTRALDGSEITANMSRELDSLSVQGLGGYWRFNENSGTTTYDVSGNSQPVNLVSANWDVSVPFSIQLPPAPIVTVSNWFTLTSSYATGNQWYRNGAPIQGATQQQYVATQNGTYLAEITDSVGCKSQSLPVQITTVASQNLGGQNLQAWPVPFSESLQLELPEAGTLEVFSLDGRLVERVILNGNLNHRLETRNWTNGVYMLRLQTNAALYQLKVAKQ